MKRIIILILAVMTIVSCNGGKQTDEKTSYKIPEPVNIIEGYGKIEPEHGILDIASEVSGTIKEIMVDNSQHVSQGDTLLVIDTENAELTLNKSKNKIQTQISIIKEAEATLAKSKIDFEVTEEDMETARRLYKKGAESKQKTTELENQLKLKKAIYEENIQKLNSANLLLKEIKNEVSIAAENLEKCIIKAPADGKVLNIEVEKGNIIQAYSQVVTFAADEPVIVLAEIDELFAGKLKLGQKAEIHLIGYNDIIATGKITNMRDYLSDKSIFSGSSNEMQNRQMRKIEITLDNQEETPLLGTKVSCRIQL